MAHADVMKRRELELSFGWLVVRAPTGGVAFIQWSPSSHWTRTASIASIPLPSSTAEYESSSAEGSIRHCATRF